MKSAIRYEFVNVGVSHGYPCDFCGRVIQSEKGWGLKRACNLPPDHKNHPLAPCPATCERGFAHDECARKAGKHPYS